MPEVSLRDRRQALLERTDLLGADFCRSYANAADEWLAAVADRATGGNSRHLALLAVGGYGRGELCPFSDLDVVLVHDGRRDIAAIADAIWYPVWDQGVHLDHSVRRPREVLDAAEADLQVALGLLDARLIWGEPKVSEPLLESTVELWRKRLGEQWLPSLLEQMTERHRNQGDVAFLLEPDLKESHGGLRDVNVLRAVAEYAPLLEDYVDLGSIEPAAAVLTSVRVELHRSAGRALEKLLLQDQDHVAKVLAYADADALMAAVSRAGRAISWVTDDAWRRRHLWQPEQSKGRRSRRSGSSNLEPVTQDREPGIVTIGGEVALTPTAPVADDPSLPLRVAAVAAELDLPISRGALHRMADKSPPPHDPWPVEMLSDFVRVLRTGHRAIAALEALDQHNLLARILPEWQSVRNKPQRNAYHRFTVDRHLLEAAANAAALADGVDRVDLLLIGTLLHDIGKGYPGDHTDVGIELVEIIGGRMGFVPHDVETLKAMVRYHLLLPDTATRRDLDDPTTIETVVNAAGNKETLELLGALTEADSLATGSSAWGGWKAGLVKELVHRAGLAMEGKPTPSSTSWVTDAHRQMMGVVRASGRPSVSVEPPRVIVAAPDRPGLLASVAGTLALQGLSVRSADVTSEDSVALEVFIVETSRDRWPDNDALREDLDLVLSNRVALGDQLAEKAKAYAVNRRPDAARPMLPDVVIDNDASTVATVIEVRAPDEVGLLHRVTQALFDCDVDVASAHVSTIGSAVVDAFYVRTSGGQKVTDIDLLRRLEVTLRTAVE